MHINYHRILYNGYISNIFYNYYNYFFNERVGCIARLTFKYEWNSKLKWKRNKIEPFAADVFINKVIIRILQSIIIKIKKHALMDVVCQKK